jgi:L-histidine Nalpha-methyltransferase
MRAMTAPVLQSTIATDVREHLQRTPRQLPTRLLYDSLGSALFDAICELPWYDITRAETRLLAAHRGEIFAGLPGLSQIVELGPGDGRKLLTLVGGTAQPLIAHLVDVSAGALDRAAHTVSSAAHVVVTGHQASFEDGLDDIARRRADGATLVLFLGSNIGNFDPQASAALLGRMRASLEPGDAVLIGADLVKPERDLLIAYDDPLGVSAAFNLNILQRINHELGANFDLRAFRHRAVWNAACSRMEMFVVSTTAQRVDIPAIHLNIALQPGEGIWTESSYKYSPERLARQLEDAGFDPVARWVDDEAAFALTLTRVIQRP